MPRLRPPVQVCEAASSRGWHALSCQQGTAAQGTQCCSTSDTQVGNARQQQLLQVESASPGVWD